jgi:hypothetical protein
MASSKPVSFSIDYDEEGWIVRVRKANGEVVPSQSAAMLPQRLSEMRRGTAEPNKTITEIYCNTTTPSGGQNDPCILQGGDLWCW